MSASDLRTDDVATATATATATAGPAATPGVRVGLRGRLRSIAGYALATGGQALAGFLVVPMAVRLLGAEEFGRFSLWEPVGATLAPFVLLGLHHGLLKLVGEDRIPAADALWQLLPVAASLLLAAVTVAAIVGVLAPATRGALGPVAALVLAEGVLVLCLSAARAADRSLDFAAMSLLKVGCYLGIVAMAALTGTPAIDSADALLGWMALASGLAAAYGLVRHLGRRSTALADRRRHVAAAFRYGWPVTGAAALAAGATLGDRYVLTHWVGHAQIGHYVVMLKMAAALNFVVMPLNMWFPAARFHHLRDADGGHRFFRGTSRAVLVVLVAVAGLIYVAGPALLHLMSPRQAWDPLLAALLLGTVLVNGMTSTMNVGLLASGRTHLLLWGGVVALAAQYAMFLALIPVWGAVGAATATLVGASTSLAIQHALSQRAHPVPYPYVEMALSLAGMAAITAVAARLPVAVAVPVVAAAGAALLLRQRQRQRRGLPGRDAPLPPARAR